MAIFELWEESNTQFQRKPQLKSKPTQSKPNDAFPPSSSPRNLILLQTQYRMNSSVSRGLSPKHTAPSVVLSCPATAPLQQEARLSERKGIKLPWSQEQPRTGTTITLDEVLRTQPPLRERLGSGHCFYHPDAAETQIYQHLTPNHPEPPQCS